MKRREFLELAVSSAGAVMLGACATSPPLAFDAGLLHVPYSYHGCWWAER